MTQKQIIALDLASKLQGDKGYVIGFGGKRYTLWSFHRELTNNGACLLTLQYLHNLSSYKDSVQCRFPDAPIVEELKGTHFVINTESKRKSEPTVKKTFFDYMMNIPYGRYAGKSAKEVDDCSYWCYLANHTKDDEMSRVDGQDICFKPLFVERAKETGAVKAWNYWVNPNDTNPKNQWMVDAARIYNAVQNNEPFEFVADRNSDCFRKGCWIHFKVEDTTVSATYYGVNTYIKVTNKKGKTSNKRIKGHTVKVNEYHFEGSDLIIDKFEIK